MEEGVEQIMLAVVVRGRKEVEQMILAMVVRGRNLGSSAAMSAEITKHH